MAKRPEEALAGMIASLKEKTGRSLDEWLDVIGTSGRTKHREIVELLKSEYGVSHGYANQIALRALAGGNPSSSASDEIDSQFQGPKSAMRPIYDKVMAGVQRFGSDVDVAPKKGYVSLRRSKQFAILQPSTATRLDVGINLKGVVPSGRLEASGSFNAMLSHRVRVSDVNQVDDELLGWLRQAYDAA